MKPAATQNPERRSAMLSYFSLFTSLSTLLCCALPSLLVLFGLGASVASMLAFTPWLVALSRRKVWTFSISGTLIGLSFVNLYYFVPRLKDGDVCEVDDGSACRDASRVSQARCVALDRRPRVDTCQSPTGTCRVATRCPCGSVTLVAAGSRSDATMCRLPAKPLGVSRANVPGAPVVDRYTSRVVTQFIFDHPERYRLVGSQREDYPAFYPPMEYYVFDVRSRLQ